MGVTRLLPGTQSAWRRCVWVCHTASFRLSNTIRYESKTGRESWLSWRATWLMRPQSALSWPTVCAIMAAQLFYTAVVLLFYADTAAGWGLCNDDNPACGYWAKNGECDGANKEFMQKTCPHSCGMCHLLCADVEDSCATWAKDGHCESNPGFMFKSCPTACGVCHQNATTRSPTTSVAIGPVRASARRTRQFCRRARSRVAFARACASTN